MAKYTYAYANLKGYVGADVSLSKGGRHVAFSLSCNERWTKDGQDFSETSWTRVVAFGELAKALADPKKGLKKGDKVEVLQGLLRTRTYEDPKSPGKLCWITEVKIGPRTDITVEERAVDRAVLKAHHGHQEDEDEAA